VLQQLFAEFFGRRGNHRRPTKRTYRPTIDVLEDRYVLSTFTWDWKAGNPNANWSTPGNWTKVGTDAGGYPGDQVATDSAIFDTGSNNPCTVDVANVTIANLTIASTYTSVVTVTGNLDVKSTADQSGGTIAGGNVSIWSPGTYNWSGGTLQGGAGNWFTIGRTATLNITGDNDKTFDGRPVLMLGTTTWTGAGSINMIHNAWLDISKVTGGFGVFNANASGSITTPAQDTATVTVTSGATMNSAAPGQGNQLGVTEIKTPFVNNGTVNINSGHMRLWRGSTTTGVFQIAAASKLYFALSPVNTFQDGSSVTGTGVAFLTSGSHVTINGIVNMVNVTDTWYSSESFPASLIDGPGTLRISGTYTWQGGSWKDSGVTQILAGGRLWITGEEGSLTASVDARALENYGTVDWSDNDINYSNGAKITNFAGSLFDVKTDHSLFDKGGAKEFTTNVGATLRKSAGSGTATIELKPVKTATMRKNRGNSTLRKKEQCWTAR
jgi:hypothetical protein